MGAKGPIAPVLNMYAPVIDIKHVFQENASLGTLFIDTYYRDEDKNQKEKFDKYTQMLWDFAEKVEPFACKDVEVALTELGKETENNINLSKNLTDTIEEKKSLKDEKHELEKTLESLNKTSHDKIEKLEGSLQSTKKTLTETINEKIKLEKNLTSLNETLFDEKKKFNTKIDELIENLNKTTDEEKKLKNKLEKLKIENLTQKPIKEVTDVTGLTKENLAKVNESETETLINQANLGSTGSSPGILALVACIAFIFGCATVLVVQKVRKRKGNAGKI